MHLLTNCLFIQITSLWQHRLSWFCSHGRSVARVRLPLATSPYSAKFFLFRHGPRTDMTSEMVATDRRQVKDSQDHDSSDCVSLSEESEAEDGLAVTRDGLAQQVANNQQMAPPSIGSIAVCNSSDVHFGNKTYIHGPVTIRQFVSNTKDDVVCGANGIYSNSAFNLDTQKVLAKCEHQKQQIQQEPQIFNSLPCVKWLSLKIRSSPGTALVVCLLVAISLTACALLAVTFTRNTEEIMGGSWQSSEDLNGVKPIKTDIDKVLQLSRGLRIITRQQWLAQPATGPLDPLETPVNLVIIAHTATENCTDQASCIFNVRQTQTYHIESMGWYDIGYNFMVGGDGSVYECRGWDKMGAHTKSYNNGSIGIGFIGTFLTVLPPDRQLLAARRLIELGVTKNKISRDYKLVGHRQLIPSLSPGQALFDEISKWPHFAQKLDDVIKIDNV